MHIDQIGRDRFAKQAIHDANWARSGPIEVNQSNAAVSTVTEIGKMTSELLFRLSA